MKQPPRILATLLALLLLPAWAAADGSHHTLWAVHGRHNTVYLLGSVHVLRPEDSALPVEAEAAYQHARTLVLEVAVDRDFAPDALRAAMLAQGTLPPGRTLHAEIGDALYAQLGVRARAFGLDAAWLDGLRPWLVALLLQQAELARAGYAAEAGVDLQLAGQAQADHKPVVGLETLEEQFGLFAHLTDAQQRAFLAQTLAELDELGAEAGEIVAAWRAGDTRGLEAALRKSRDESPDLFRVLTTDRNRRWLPRILALLERDEDCLVIVGALHLVGRDGLVALLEQRGFHPVQE
ncbi:MAG: TraB/GumN family protein [Steroidobacteraceae bacterium]